MKLYYTKGACSLAPRIIINELNLPCEYESVDLAQKKTQSGTDFYSINPKGSVPTLITDNNDVLTEAVVILQYLSDTQDATSLLPPLNHWQRYKVLEWLNFVATEMHKGLGIFFNPAITEEMKEKIYLPVLYKRFDFINQQLTKTEYLAGSHFTLPDAYLFVVSTWAFYFKLDLTKWSAFQAYLQKIVKRPSVIKSLEEEQIKILSMA